MQMMEVTGGLKRSRVSMSGAWAPEKIRRWKGLVKADELIVAVAFVLREGRTSWSKSQPARGPELEVDLLLGHHDAGGLDVQVNFSAGSGQVISRCLLESVEFRPDLFTDRLKATGSVVQLGGPFGSPEITLSLLVLAASDVKVGRNRLWHLRPAVSTGLSEPYLGVLTHGRSGEYAA